jgi:hypothetical protein
MSVFYSLALAPNGPQAGTRARVREAKNTNVRRDLKM